MQWQKKLVNYLNLQNEKYKTNIAANITIVYQSNSRGFYKMKKIIA